MSCRAIANAQGIGRCYAVLQQIGDAEGSKNSNAVRADLNTGAFFGKDGAAFADVRCDAASCKCERRCEAPDAAACNHGARSTCCHECMLTVAALRALVASGCVRYEAALWVALIRFKTRIVNITPTKMRSAPTSLAKCGINAPAMRLPSRIGDLRTYHTVGAAMMVGDDAHLSFEVSGYGNDTL